MKNKKSSVSIGIKGEQAAQEPNSKNLTTILALLHRPQAAPAVITMYLLPLAGSLTQPVEAEEGSLGSISHRAAPQKRSDWLFYGLDSAFLFNLMHASDVNDQGSHMEIQVVELHEVSER